MGRTFLFTRLLTALRSPRCGVRPHLKSGSASPKRDVELAELVNRLLHYGVVLLGFLVALQQLNIRLEALLAAWSERNAGLRSLLAIETPDLSEAELEQLRLLGYTEH